MNESEILLKLNQELFRDIEDNKNSFPEKRPLLAHYTSIENFENILRTNKVWFSNPLFMNDLEELRFVILEGHKLFNLNETLEKQFEPIIYNKLIETFNFYFDEFSNKHALDVYAFCLSEHEKEKDIDGKLSMWRGYGGNGNGVAVVFDSKKFGDGSNHALIISNVDYKSKQERIDWINNKINEFIVVIKNLNLTKDNIHLASLAFFQRLLTFALFTKHKGFEEEKEWRIVYLKYWFTNDVLDKMLNYSFGKRGIEPKFILPIEPIEGVIQEGITLDDIIDSIILGPTISNHLTKSSVGRMLKNLGKDSLIDKLKFSEIPFRWA